MKSGKDQLIRGAYTIETSYDCPHYPVSWGMNDATSAIRSAVSAITALALGYAAF